MKPTVTALVLLVLMVLATTDPTNGKFIGFNLKDAFKPAVVNPTEKPSGKFIGFNLQDALKPADVNPTEKPSAFEVEVIKKLDQIMTQMRKICLNRWHW